ncbi:PD-(D/E)XK motif protein [Flavobacterium sp. PL02]|uniref:PD-(D/E)XK motif protein n=1 Tax=Flavobacterium sp. PL02 TaxID=3088354 RepID=UPI002B22FA82|nr:PD-(D/E)XK motif protein [Flavobacterium sp. PL02]MEA9412662.1 PD-(D/E)XK motif protein [Flavobacterium sp. PL02]
MTELYNVFSSLNSNDRNDEYIVGEIPKLINHKIGVSSEGYPVFFVKTLKSKKKILNKSLEIIKIEFNKECALFVNGNKEISSYTLITLKSETPEIQSYFLEILLLSIEKISPIPTVDEIEGQLNSLIALFRDFSRIPLKTIQGVWSEMIVIESAKNVDYLVQSWHSSIFSKFDFNDGIDKIEVKSTSKDRRIHRFSLSQLSRNTSSHLVIASIMTSEVGIGCNVFDIREKIYQKLKNKNLIVKVDEILSKTLGNNIEKSIDCFFDYNSAFDSLQFYQSESIPNIDGEIPSQISNISFDCDISNVSPIEILSTESILLNSL